MLKNEKGLTGIDTVFAVIIIIIFTSIILSLMYNVKLQNTKQIYKLASNIYLTETMENIGIADFADVVSTNSDENTNLIPELPSMFSEIIEVENAINQANTASDDIIKKVTVTVTYNIGNKTYENTIQRLKTNE